MSYKFVQLDPRPQAADKMSQLFAKSTVFGLEVTVPALAEQCIDNLDHHGTDSWREPAILQALKAALPPDDAVLATIRPDLDSIGAMVVLMLRVEGIAINVSILRRIHLIAQADAWSIQAAQKWQPGTLPTIDNPWPKTTEPQELLAIAAAVADRKVPLEQRVKLMQYWICTGEEPAGYREQVENERLELVRALEDGTIQRAANDGIATVISTHRAATTVGYTLAPVVVAYNPTFSVGIGEPYAKYTICQHAPVYVDLPTVFAELSAIEPGWGGNATIGGSPQGVSSRLLLEDVVEVVKKHLK